MRKMFFSFSVFVSLFSNYSFAAEFHASNEFSAYYNDVSGAGKSQSSLTDGPGYLDTLNLYGLGEKKGLKYNYNLGLKFTDDRKNDIKTFRLQIYPALSIRKAIR